MSKNSILKILNIFNLKALRKHEKQNFKPFRIKYQRIFFDSKA